MRINTRVRYAIRMMADMAKHGHGEPVALRDVAARQNLPKMYLSQLMAPLKSAGLIKSFWGNRGGYVLNRPASEITLLDIIEAVEGPIALLDCVLDPELCERSDYCECIGVWQTINESIVATLQHYTLADLVSRTRPVTRMGKSCVIGTTREEVAHDIHDSIYPTAGSHDSRESHPPAKR